MIDKTQYLPREKADKKGIETLSDIELLALIIASGNKNRTMLDISKDVLQVIKSVDKKRLFEIRSYLDINGINRAKLYKILAGIELGKRIFESTSSVVSVSITDTVKAVEVFSNIRTKKQEYFVGIYLDARYMLLQYKTIHIGTVNKVEINPRDVLSTALEFLGSKTKCTTLS